MQRQLRHLFGFREQAVFLKRKRMKAQNEAKTGA
jgi:hypothetical protein